MEFSNEFTGTLPLNFKEKSSRLPTTTSLDARPSSTKLKEAYEMSKIKTSGVAAFGLKYDNSNVVK